MDQALHIVCPHCNATNRVPPARLGDGARCGKCKQALFDAHPVELTEATFATHIDHSEIPVVVDFWAPWCAPCRMMAPAFEQAAAQLEPNVRFAKVNTDNAPALGTRFNIRSIPTVMLFRRGGEVARQSGALDARSLVQWLRSHL